MMHGGVMLPTGCDQRHRGTRCRLAANHDGGCVWPIAAARESARCCPDMDLEVVTVGIDFRPTNGMCVELACKKCGVTWQADVLDPEITP